MDNLRGKRFTYFDDDELDEMDEIPIGAIKQWTGGDTVYARHQFEGPPDAE